MAHVVFASRCSVSVYVVRMTTSIPLCFAMGSRYCICRRSKDRSCEEAGSDLTHQASYAGDSSTRGCCAGSCIDTSSKLFLTPSSSGSGGSSGSGTGTSMAVCESLARAVISRWPASVSGAPSEPSSFFLLQCWQLRMTRGRHRQAGLPTYLPDHLKPASLESSTCLKCYNPPS